MGSSEYDLDVYNTDFLPREHSSREFPSGPPYESHVPLSQKYPTLYFRWDFARACSVCAMFAACTGGAAGGRAGVPENPGQVCPLSVEVGYEQDND